MEEQVSVKQIAIKYGLILAIFSVLFFLLLVLTDQTDNRLLGFTGYIPLIIVVVLAHRAYKAEGDGFMSYSRGLGLGTLVVTISAVVSSIFSYIYTKFIDTEFYENLRKKMEDTWAEEGMSEEQIETVSSFMEKFSTPEISFLFGVLGAIFIGFILSLIITAFTKNTRPEEI